MLKVTLLATILALALPACQSSGPIDHDEPEVPHEDAEDTPTRPPLPSPLFLEYGGVEGDNYLDEYGPQPIDACWLTGPGETLALARVISATRSPNTRDCEVEKLYLDAYMELELDPLKTTGELGSGPITVLALFWSTGVWDLEADDTILISYRESEGVLFSLAYLPVQVRSAQAEDQHGAVTLPDTWEELEPLALDIQEHHESKCPLLWSQGPGESRRMTDDEFDVWIRSPEERVWCGDDWPPPEPDEPQPGDVQNDFDLGHGD